MGGWNEIEGPYCRYCRTQFSDVKAVVCKSVSEAEECLKAQQKALKGRRV
jgi:hypothetical protein